MVGPAVSVNDALLSFASMDHASLLGLGELGIEGLRELCSFGGSEGTPESVMGQEIVPVVEIDVGGMVRMVRLMVKVIAVLEQVLVMVMLVRWLWVMERMLGRVPRHRVLPLLGCKNLSA